MLTKPRVASPLPTGTVTLLFTDVEGSTHLWDAHPEAMRAALARHDALVRAAIVESGGYVFKTVGDAFCAAFAMAADALTAGLAAQRAIMDEAWPEDTRITARMALHTGAVESRDDDYFGAPLNRVARLLATGHGGQTLLSQTTYDLVRDSLPDAVSLHDLGAHKLKDLARPEQVFQMQHPSLRNEFPPIRSLSTHPNNLPQQLTRFIGREKEIAEIKALLARNRLVTLTGAGGSGKSRLSLQIAADVLERFSDGAWFVEFAAVADPSLVPQTVASALGVKEERGKSITHTLTEYLQQRRLLLVLDNCEHVLDACASVADTILRQCPGATIMTTSREALRVAGERSYRVPSLSLPDREQVQSPQSLSAYESVRLFIDRALLVRADFEVTNRNAPALASVCCRLDGIPLAIELAAARVRTLSVDEIDGKLDQRFRLLIGGSRTAMPRQQTLRSLIDWSYDLLHEPEKRLLQSLSAFAGGWTLQAAASVCAGNGIADGDVLDLLTSLADKSLVTAEQNDGHSRYTLLETVRQYARDKLLESGGSNAIRERHLDFFLALAEEAETYLTGAQQGEWLQHLEAEHENLWAGLEGSVLDTGSRRGLRLCGALQRFWTMRGHISEGRKWCERMLEMTGGDERTPERAKVLNGAGTLAHSHADYRAARALYEESLAITRELGDGAGTSRALNNLGTVAWAQGDWPAARALYEESLAIRRGLKDRAGMSVSLNNLGNVADDQGDRSGARALYEESLAILRELGDWLGISTSLNNLGCIAQGQGDLPAARALFEESLTLRRELGDRWGTAGSLANLGSVAYAQGDYAAAATLHRESLAIRGELGERLGIAYSLEGLAEAVGSLGSFLLAVRIWGAAERLREEIGSPLSPRDSLGRDKSVAAARRALDDDAAFDEAWQEGRALTLEQAIELALEKFISNE